MPSDQMKPSVPDYVVKVRLGNRWHVRYPLVVRVKKNGRNDEENWKDNELPRMREQ